MTYRGARKTNAAWALVAAIAMGPAFGSGSAFAAETPETFMSKVDHDKDKTLSLPEITDYALKTFDALDVDHDGTLTASELGDRLSPEAFATADTKHDAGAKTLSRSEFSTYVAKLFVDANEHRKPGQTKADGTLSVDELATPAGLKLIKLLE